MKVCDLTQSFAETGGGVRTYLEAKREHLLARTDFAYVRIVPGARDETVREGRTVTHRVASPRVPGSGEYRFLLRSGRVLRLLEAERPDVIEVHCAYNLPWTALFHRRCHPAAVVGFCMTDVRAAYVEPAVSRHLGRWAAERAGRWTDLYVGALYRRCDATVAISMEGAERLRALGVANVRFIPLGVDFDLFHPGRRDPGIRRRLGAGEGDLLMVYAGRLDREKRPDLLVDAVERLPAEVPAVLVLVGEGPLRRELEDRARRNGRVRVLPFIADRSELAAILASADLYVSAMPHETFGLSVVEAQGCGLPVLGVGAGAMVERVPPGTGFLVPPDEPEALAHRIATVPREEWRRMGRRARAHVEARFPWRRTFDELLGLYDRVRPGGPRPRSGAPAVPAISRARR